ncbi:dipeptidyl-peptidase II [Fistulifera solaris]|uniref:Dipeptidyl-peptidase II n=1 Tax=Fistulifera solaris TaxID=1519565 RepID=A0A1Z5K3C7_FISSO|nr:dipeptidyl-peptidase II [Fistulifera solaris]|eukprot:GAX20740.1 dipeptidyl-peptidase II [Fistulifera solaris]
MTRYGSIPIVTNAHEVVAFLETADESFSIDYERQNRRRAPLLLLAAFALGCVAYITVPSASWTTAHMMMHGTPYHRKRHLLDNKLDGKEMWYPHQSVDQLDPKDHRTWSHRFYKVSKHFQGPGHPIFVVISGEDDLDSLLYPFIEEGMASKFGAFVIEPEHRFYGKSRPLKHESVAKYSHYLSPDQALLDLVQLVQATRTELGCSLSRTSPKYCPVITVGGSYPGYLSAMARFLFPDYIDMSYASSAPVQLYSQNVDAYSYYDKVSDVAEAMSPGCRDASRRLLDELRETVLNSDWSVHQAAEKLGYCSHTLPSYFHDLETLVEEGVVYIVPAIFAEFNMFSYPPGPKTQNARVCEIFKNESLTAFEKFHGFFSIRGGLVKRKDGSSCFDMMSEMPAGKHSRLMGSDWSGTGEGRTGLIWEFQCCTDLVIRTGYSNSSMFYPREFSYEWLEDHCAARFPGFHWNPMRLQNEWNFDQMEGASNIVFTNGMNDGWAVTGSFLHDLSDTVLAINIEDGAHHSDLGPKYPNDDDTIAVKNAQQQVMDILEKWLNEIKAGQV